MSMTGMTFQEKNFENMIHYYKLELLKVYEAKNQYIAIMSLPKSTQRTLINNGIISGRKYNRRITDEALKHLV
jgi:hypothetical protein